jgi:hypothetical protein
MRFEHRLHARAEPLEIGVPDNAGTGAQRPIAPARRHGGDAVDELGLADRGIGLIVLGPVHRSTLKIDRRENRVAGAEVLQQVVEEIALLPVPQMMMRIDDRPFRLDRLLDQSRKPSLVHRIVDGGPRRLVAHGVLRFRCAS